MSRVAVAWILLLSMALALPARAQGMGPCGGFVTHLWVPQPSGHVGSITVGGGGSYGGGTHGLSSAGGNGGGGGGHEATPVGGDASGGNSGGSSSGGGGGGDGAVVLLLVVVAAAVALPIVVYAVDEDAHPDVMQCWATPEERLAFYGGTTSEIGPTPFLGTRALLHWYAMGMEGGVEGTRYGSFDIHGSFMARIPPKQHLEFALGLGGRRMYSTLGSASWFEVSLPQRYTPFRWSALEPGISFDLRPAFLFNPAGGIWDVRLDAAIVFPLGPWASIDLGGRAYSFQGSVQGGAMLGLQLSL